MQYRELALFDFDGTLCSGDSIFPYLLFAVRKGYAPKKQLLQALKGYLRYLLNGKLTVQAKEDTLSFMQGKSREEMDKIACEFFSEVLCPKFYKQGQQELERLKKAGKTIVIVSASPDVYMRVLPAFMPLVDAVIATQCVVDDEGCYTGRISHNCKGEEKPVLIKRFLDAQGWHMDAENSCAYGDSYSDSYMLKMTGEPVAVNAKTKLLRYMPGIRQVTWR